MAGSLLWLLHQPPLPAVSGSRVRSLALVRELAQRGWDVALFALDTGVPAQPQHLAELRDLCGDVRIVAHSVPRPVRMARIGADLLRGRAFQHSMFRTAAAVRAAHAWIEHDGFDAIVAGGLYMLPYVPRAALPRTLLDSHNVDTERIASMAAALWPRPRGVLARVQQRPVRRYEERAAASVAGVLAVSAAEAAWFQRVAPSRVSLVPNGVDTTRIQPREGVGAGGPVLFVGSMDYGANADGARVLLTEIAPRLRHPAARIALVGALPSPDLRAAAQAAPVPVEVTGRVERIEPWFAAGRLLAVPLRMGGGTRLKILEAMAHGVPVVTTSIGCAGLDVEHERDVIVADDPADFACWVDRLLEDDELVAAIGARARAAVRRDHDWSASGAALEAALRVLC